MKLKDEEYEYCLNYKDQYPKQCIKCKRNVKLYSDVNNRPLYWITDKLFPFKKKCPCFDKINEVK